MSNTLTIQRNNAVEAYNKADDAGKQLLENLFTKKELFQSVKDRVKTFEDACNELGITWKDIAGLSPDEVAYQKIKIIAQAINEGWKPDWNNSSQYKYYPWFDMSGGFSCDYYDGWFASSAVGSRLCFRSADLAIYAGQQFTDLYKTMFVL